MRFLISNKLTADNVTLTGAKVSFPLVNMLGNVLIEKTAFTDEVYIDMGSAQLINGIGLIVDDLTGYTIEGNASAVWTTSPAYSASLTSSVTFISETYRYWKIKKTGDNLINHLFLGEYYQMISPIVGSFPSIINNDVIITSLSGTANITAGILIKSWAYEFHSVLYSVWDSFISLYNSLRGTCFMLVPFEESMTIYPPFFVRMGEYETTARDKLIVDFKQNFIEVK